LPWPSGRSSGFTPPILKPRSTKLAEDYQGCFTSLADFAKTLTCDTGGLEGIPDHLARYIDRAALGCDMQCNGSILLIETGSEEQHIFWQR